MHAHHYREPDVLRGQAGARARDRQLRRRHRGRVLADRRQDLPRRCAAAPTSCPSTSTASRSTSASHADHLDAAAARCSASSRCGRWSIASAGDTTAYGLPKPDHKLLRGAPDRLLGAAAAARPRRHHGQAQHRPLRRRPHGALRRRQRGGDRPRRLLHRATRSPSRSSTRRCSPRPDNRLPLYRRVVSVERPGLYFIGFIQPLGPDHAAGRGPVRSGSPTCSTAARRYRRRRRCSEEIASEERRMRKRFVASKRHTVEVDFHPYLREIRRERKRAAQPA